MTIRQKLLVNSLITFAGFTAIVLLGYSTITGFQDRRVKLEKLSKEIQELKGTPLDVSIFSTLTQQDSGKAVEAMQQSLGRVHKGVRLSQEAGLALSSIVATVLTACRR